jgi:alpha,alpha-trehalase
MQSQEAARQLARTRVETCLALFRARGHLLEKYDCEDPAQAGGGGEYQVQLGFGWTNGALLDLMTTIDM